MKTLTPITDTVVLDEDQRAPADAWTFAKLIEGKQKYHDDKLFERHTILFNKGRYFETSVYDKEVREGVSELAGIPVEYNVMLVGSWKKLEEFVLAMNCFGIYVHINVDWI